MFLPHLLQNSDDSDNIWYIIFWINLPQSNINIFHLTEIMSLYHSKNHRSKWQRPGAQYRPSNAWSLMRRSTVFHWLKYVSKMWPRSPRRTLLGLRSLPNTTTLQGFKSANGNQTNTTNSRAVMLSWLFLGGGQICRGRVISRGCPWGNVQGECMGNVPRWLTRRNILIVS